MSDSKSSSAAVPTRPVTLPKRTVNVPTTPVKKTAQFATKPISLPAAKTMPVTTAEKVAKKSAVRERFTQLFKKQPARPRLTRKKSKLGQKWQTLNRYVINQLQTPKTLRREWFIILGLSLFFITFYATLVGLMQFFASRANTSYPAIYNAQDLNHVMWALSIFCLVLLFSPYLYVFAAFFAGINQIQRSKAVHFMIWTTFIVQGILVICCCAMLIAAYYGLDAYNLDHNLA